MFPAWIATKPDGQPVAAGSDDPQCLAVFATVGDAKEFMRQAGEADWKFKLVNHADFLEMVAELREHGLIGFCYDPGGEAKTVSLDELA